MTLTFAINIGMITSYHNSRRTERTIAEQELYDRRQRIIREKLGQGSPELTDDEKDICIENYEDFDRAMKDLL